MLLRHTLAWLGATRGLLSGVGAIELDVTNEKSINDAASTAITNAMVFVDPGTGLLYKPQYYWWEMGALMGILVQRWSITKNDTYNDYITKHTLAQIGEEQNFEPRAENAELGNDDQAFWAFTALDMAELGFPDPPAGNPSWIGLAQAVFNRQTIQWDSKTCGGGMRWQKFNINIGYDYKNIASNGGYFQIAARLARYTANNTYVEYADKMWDWISHSGMWQLDDHGNLDLFDGVHVDVCDDKTKHDPPRFTYNIGQMISGAAYLYDYSTGADKDKWKTRVDLLLNATDRFFFTSLDANADNKAPKVGGPIMGELQCEFTPQQACNNDMPAFKGFLTRWLSMTSVLAPWTNTTIYPRLIGGANGAAAQCTGTAKNQIPGTSCGRRWYQTTWDSFSGVGEQMSAASAFQALNIHNAKPPFTAKKGGTSKSNPGQGNSDSDDPSLPKVYSQKITAGDRAGAGILTTLGLAFLLGGLYFIIT